MSANTSPTITLIDDDQNISTSLGMTLESEGYEVLSYYDGVSGLEGVQKNLPDVIVLDIKMPKMDGLEVLQKLRNNPDTADLPIIMLTSKNDEIDELMGFRLGADDYVAKPFSQKLLLARIEALLKRKAMQAAPAKDQSDRNEGQIICGDLVMDDGRHLCTWKGEAMSLTVTEYLLIKALAERPGHVRSRDQLIDAAYGQNIYVEDRTIDSHVKRIRGKFRKIDPEFNRIETLYGVGYKYNDA